MTLFAPKIAGFALSFGPPEKFSLAVVGLLMAVTLSGASVVKGLIMMALGLLLASVGLDPISGKTRFSFGVIELQSGFDFVTLAMGVFGLGEIFSGLESAVKSEIVTTKVGQVWPTVKDWVESRMAILRGTLIGFVIGDHPRRRRGHLLPGLLRRGEEGVETSRGVRPGCDRRGGGPGIGEQRRVEFVVHPAC